MLLCLKHADSSSEPVNISHHLVHESDRHVWQEVEDVDGGPGALPKEVSGIWPLMCCRALHHDATLRHAESTLFVPLLQDRDWLFLTLCDTAIVVQSLAKH